MSKPNGTAAELVGQLADEYFGKLEEVRRQRADLLDQIEEIKNAPLPLADVIARVEAFVADNSLIPGLDSFFCPYETREPPLTVEAHFNHSPLMVVNDLVVGNREAKVNLAGVLCSLFPDAIKKTLIEEATKEAEFYPDSPPLNQRNGLISELRAKIFTLEIEEEKLICETHAASVVGAWRRGDVDPETVLMMDVADA
jgi:hypothetical protein